MEKRHFETPIDVKHDDVDAMGQVSSAVYYDYLQHAYLSFMHTLLDIPSNEKLPHIMVKTACEYLTPARYGDRLTVRSSVTSFGSRSFELEHLMSREDEARTVLAKGYSTHVMYDYSRNLSLPVPEEFKKRVERFQGTL